MNHAMKTIKKFALLNCCLIAVGWLITTKFVIGHVVSDSMNLQQKWFLLLKHSKIQQADLVTFKKPSVTDDGLLLKRVVGLPGDKIIKTPSGEIWISSQQLHATVKVGKVLEKNSKNEKLHSIKEGIIPEGYVFVAGDHKKSFDSRYEEFGLVNNVESRAIPLF